RGSRTYLWVVPGLFECIRSHMVRGTDARVQCIIPGNAFTGVGEKRKLMRRLKGLCLLGMIGGFLVAPAAHAGMILNFFPASVYNTNTPAMYSTLGISGGYMVDNFESGTLLPGLSITLAGGVPATTWTSSIPNLSNGFDCGIPTWDGTHAVTN